MTILVRLLKLTEKRSFNYDKMSNYPQKADLVESDDFRLVPRSYVKSPIWVKMNWFFISNLELSQKRSFFPQMSNNAERLDFGKNGQKLTNITRFPEFTHKRSFFWMSKYAKPWKFWLDFSIWRRNSVWASTKCVTALKGQTYVQTDRKWRFLLDFSNFLENALLTTRKCVTILKGLIWAKRD